MNENVQEIITDVVENQNDSAVDTIPTAPSVENEVVVSSGDDSGISVDNGNIPESPIDSNGGFTIDEITVDEVTGDEITSDVSPSNNVDVVDVQGIDYTGQIGDINLNLEKINESLEVLTSQYVDAESEVQVTVFNKKIDDYTVSETLLLSIVVAIVVFFTRGFFKKKRNF